MAKLQQQLVAEEAPAPELHFQFKAAPISGQDLLRAEGLAMRFGDNQLFSGLDFTLRRGERVFLLGPNGVGKTTSIGKMANLLRYGGKKCLLCAADTFRAAAIEQLCMWGERAGVDVIRQSSGSDPGAVVFDACQAAASRGSNILIVDTAGRLQNKTNLMEELRKINRIIEREAPQANVEVLLVLDSGTGQNAISQAKLFGEVVPLSGIILTKLDGTAKGGVVIGIANELNLPVKMIGVGEGIDDLMPFEAEAFAKALVGGQQDETGISE